MRHLILIAALLIAPLPALGQCPASRDDARDGLEVALDDGSTIWISRAEDGLVTEDWTYSDGFRLRIRAMHGIHPTEIVELDENGNAIPGADEATSYADPFPPEPVLGAEWATSGRIRYGSDDGGKIAYASIARAAGELVIGDCRFAAVTVTLRITDGAESRLEEVDFLPELGISILRATGGAEGQDLTLLTPTHIGPAAP